MNRKKQPTAQSIAGMKERLLKDMASIREALAAGAKAEAEQALAGLDAVAAADKALELSERRHTQEEALVSLETGMAVFLQLAAASRASQVLEAMRIVEIRARMDGKHVFE